MNPDRLFNYLDGRLPPHERIALEEELMSSEEARREFEVARRIHAGMHNSRSARPEILPDDEDSTRGRKIGRQVLAAAIFLVALNVGFGLFIIARHESANPNRELLRKQSEEQLRQALSRAVTSDLTPPRLGLSDVELGVEPGKAAAVKGAMMDFAQQAGGSGTEGLENQTIVEVPGGRATEFVRALATIPGVRSVSGGEGDARGDKKTRLIIRITETK